MAFQEQQYTAEGPMGQSPPIPPKSALAALLGDPNYNIPGLDVQPEIKDADPNTTPSEKQQNSNQQPAVQQANQMAQAPFFQPNAPGGIAVAPWQQPQQSNAGAARGLADSLAAKSATPPQQVQAQKEGVKEQYLSMRKQGEDQIRQSAASRGVSGGWPAEQLAEGVAHTPLDLTTLYRNVDKENRQSELENLALALSGYQNLSGQDLQRELGQGQLSLGQGNLALGNRQQDLTEANATYDRNNILPLIISLMSGFGWDN